MTTELTVKDRAAVALGSSKAESELIELAGKSKAIVSITNKDGRTECHAAAMVAKEARVNIEKAGKAAREDATAFSKAVIAEESRLVGLIAPEEHRLINLRDDWDARVKAKKEAAEALERERIASIKSRIAEFGLMVSDAAMLEAHGAEQELEVAIAVEIDDSFCEFYGDAVEAKAVAVAKLREIVAAKTAAEATAARIKAEQEAEATRLAAERERMAAERAEMDRQRKEIEAAQANSRREAQEAAAKAESERLAAITAANQTQFEPNNQPQAITHHHPDAGNMVKLGEICNRLGFNLTAEFLANLGFSPRATDKNARLYLEADFPAICRALVCHINDVATGTVRLAA